MNLDAANNSTFNDTFVFNHLSQRITPQTEDTTNNDKDETINNGYITTMQVVKVGCKGVRNDFQNSSDTEKPYQPEGLMTFITHCVCVECFDWA